MGVNELIRVLLGWNLLKDSLKDILLFKTVKTERVAEYTELGFAEFFETFSKTLDEAVDDGHIVPSGSCKDIKESGQIINIVLVNILRVGGIEALKHLVAWLLDARQLKVVVLEVLHEYLRGIVNFHLTESVFAHCLQKLSVSFQMWWLIVLQTQHISYDVIGSTILHTIHILTKDHIVGFVGNHFLAFGRFVLKFVQGI